jgi:hypothetical protein
MSTLAIRYLNLKYGFQTLGRNRTPRVFVNSIPKSGTNLIVSLTKAFGRMKLSGPVIAQTANGSDLAGRGGGIFGHVECFEQSATDMGLDMGVLLVRAPTAYAASLARYIESNPRHPAHKALAGQEVDTLLTAVIEGMHAGPFSLEPVHDRYVRYIENAQKTGFKIVDFDRLLKDPAEGSAEQDLLRVLGGDDYASNYEAALARSRETSTTYRHSQNAPRRIALSEDMRTHSNLQKAQTVYEAALHH